METAHNFDAFEKVLKVHPEESPVSGPLQQAQLNISRLEAENILLL